MTNLRKHSLKGISDSIPVCVQDSRSEPQEFAVEELVCDPDLEYDVEEICHLHADEPGRPGARDS